MSAIVAGLSEQFGHVILLPSWVWWLLAVILLFVTAVRAYWELEREEESHRAPEPTIRLEEVVRRIRGKSDIYGPESCESMEVLKALALIKEKAGNGSIDAFGRDGSTRETDFEIKPRGRIEKEYWEKHQIDYLKFAAKKHGKIEPNPGDLVGLM